MSADVQLPIAGECDTARAAFGFLTKEDSPTIRAARSAVGGDVGRRRDGRVEEG